MESIITWMGGKRQLREIIAKYVPKDIKGYIERMDWKDLISRYDTAETVFYLDPPYWQHEHLYRRDDAERFDEHEELAKRLAGIKGKFLLSYNDCEEIRRLYEWARVKEVTAQYSVSGGRTNEIELIIGNW